MDRLNQVEVSHTTPDGFWVLSVDIDPEHEDTQVVRVIANGKTTYIHVT